LPRVPVAPGLTAADPPQQGRHLAKLFEDNVIIAGAEGGKIARDRRPARQVARAST